MKVNLPNKDLQVLSKEIRRDVFKTAMSARSGHIGGCSSSTELMTTLYFGGGLNYSPLNPFDENRDRVFVRGHLGLLRYKIFSLLGWISPDELLGYSSLHSRLQGHEDMDLVPGVDLTPSGSLGMLLSYGTGSAVAAKKLGKNFRTFVFLGDGEEQEGNVSEAARHAASLDLENLTLILDKNGKQLSHRTSYSDSSSNLKSIWRGYGWNIITLPNGHEFDQIRNAYLVANKATKRPSIIFAETIKGFGVKGCEEHYSGYHTISTAKPDDVSASIKKLDDEIDEASLGKILKKIPSLNNPPMTPNRNFASQKINIKPIKCKYHNLLDALVDYLKQFTVSAEKMSGNVYILTADIIREDIIPILGLDNPLVRFIDVGIREQHMTAMAHGLINTDRRAKVLLDVGEEFLYRNADQLNVLSQSNSPVVILGNMGGICGGRNGKTHQPAGQSGMLTFMPGMRCLEPADALDLFGALNEAFSYRRGPTYVRMHNGQMPNINTNERNCSYYPVFSDENPQITVVSNGLTLKGVMDSREILSGRGIGLKAINVIDRLCLDEKFVELLEPKKPVLTIYNGNPDSLAYPVANAIAGFSNFSKRPGRLCAHGFKFGTSGDLSDLMRHFKFDGESIAKMVREAIYGEK